MAKTAEKTTGDPMTLQDVLRELDARGGAVSNKDIFELLQRVSPLMPPGWTSADDIRELRGPLPEDDPDFANVDRR